MMPQWPPSLPNARAGGWFHPRSESDGPPALRGTPAWAGRYQQRAGPGYGPGKQGQVPSRPGAAPASVQVVTSSSHAPCQCVRFWPAAAVWELRVARVRGAATPRRGASRAGGLGHRDSAAEHGRGFRPSHNLTHKPDLIWRLAFGACRSLALRLAWSQPARLRGPESPQRPGKRKAKWACSPRSKAGSSPGDLGT